MEYASIGTAMSPQSLKKHFTDDWYKFTSDVMDPELTATILGNQVAPDNCAHSSTTESFSGSCRAFMEENGDSFQNALNHLKSRRS